MIKILIVDDEQGVCDSIKKPFSYIGFTVFTATTAKKAMSLLQKEKPKIVFLDILMPDTDGLDLLRQFKQTDPGVIVVMVTAKGDDETRRRAMESGADEFLTKPFSFDDLRSVAIEKIEKLLGQRGHAQKPHILIVDDEDKARENLISFVKPRYECEISEANDGESAIEEVKRKKPDVILLDIRMPGMSGMDAIQDIKRTVPDARIIVISAWTSPDVATKAMAMGAFDYMDKPIDLNVFQERFESALVSLGKLIRKR